MSEISLVRIENQKKKAKEYMEVEKKLGYRPRVARYPYNVVDALFSLDKQDMGKWFNSLQNNYNKYMKKLEDGEELSPSNWNCIKLYSEIIKNEKKYNVSKTYREYATLKKVEEFVEKYLLLGEIPNKDKDGCVYKFSIDNQPMHDWYFSAKSTYNKMLKEGKSNDKYKRDEVLLCKAYQKIRKVIIEANIKKISREEILEKKMQECIEKIRELGKKNGKFMIEDVRDVSFSFDNTNMKSWLNRLQTQYRLGLEKKNSGTELTSLEEKYVEVYLKVSEEIKKIKFVGLRQKKGEYIKKVTEFGYRPMSAVFNPLKVAKFELDGTDMANWFSRLANEVKVIKKESLKDEESLEKLKIYNEIKEFLNYYPRYKKDNIFLVSNLCKCYGINICDDLLVKPYREVYSKIMFMLDSQLDIQSNIKMLYMSDYNMQLKYNISIDEMIDEYIVEKFK